MSESQAYEVAESADWPQQRRDDYAAGYKFGRREVLEWERNQPNRIDMIRELRQALGLFAGAMPITPKEAWEQALDEICRLRNQ